MCKALNVNTRKCSLVDLVMQVVSTCLIYIVFIVLYLSYKFLSIERLFQQYCFIAQKPRQYIDGR